MTAKIVNLRQARKQKSRQEKEKQAAENRVKFGRTKAERTASGAQYDLERRRLDGMQRETPATGKQDDD